jgi:hypothetical protein
MFFEQACGSIITSNFSYLKRAQWELLHKDHNFTTYIPKLFLKGIQFLIHKNNFVPPPLKFEKGNYYGVNLKVKCIKDKPNLDVILHFNLGSFKFMNIL